MVHQAVNTDMCLEQQTLRTQTQQELSLSTGTMVTPSLHGQVRVSTCVRVEIPEINTAQI